MSKRGRGRGRGRGNVSFNMENIGFGRGEELPTPVLQPPPLYPKLLRTPLPLMTGAEVDYILELKKEFVQTMQNSPYYIRAEQEKSDVERYSDKYRTSRNLDSTLEWKPDWRRLPKELKISVRKRRSTSKAFTPNLKTGKLVKKQDEIDVTKTLDALEKKDNEETENTEAKASDKDDEESETEEVDGPFDQDEDEEEENDYLTSYFDNGESYLDEEDDTLEDKEGGMY